MTRRRFLKVLGSGVAMATLAACGDSGTSGAKVERTSARLVLDWVPNTNHTGLYVARENGYFEEENLDFEIIEPAEGGGEQVVGAGQVEFGIGFQEFMTPARVAGVPVVSVAAIIQHNTSGFASIAAKGITSPRDFAGKVYGGFGSPLELAFLKTMMQADGADPDDLKVVDAGAADFLTIIQRDVDLYWIFFGWQGVKAGLEGIEINTVFLKDWGVPDYYTPLIMTNEALIADNPDLVRRSLAAISRGYEYAIENPAEAAEILVKAAPETDVALVAPSQEWLSPQYQADAASWGVQDPDIWQRMSEWMAENQLVDDLIDWEAAFTNDYLPDR